MNTPGQPPAGFEPVNRGGPYFRQLGPVYVQGDVLGLFIAESHTNNYGIAHGGMLATLADGALNMVLQRVRASGERLVTVHLSTDFLAAARLGEWLQAHVQVGRQGRQLGFAECRLQVGSREVLRANGVFAVTTTPG